MDREEIVERTAEYVRDELYLDSSGHDWWHIHRVRKMAVTLANIEGANGYIVELAALLHDISDYKLNGGDHERGPRIAYEWLRKTGAAEGCAAAVAEIIASASFKGAGTQEVMATLEGKIVQDADWLDALGAIGIARAFAYGGFAGQIMHDPTQAPELHRSSSDYFMHHGTTINHFHEKLLILKDRINTDAARRVAERRHKVLETFLAEFMLEWDANDAQRVIDSL